MVKRSINSGWYISERELLERGHQETQIYYFHAESESWTNITDGGEKVNIESLPEAPENMWPLKPIMR